MDIKPCLSFILWNFLLFSISSFCEHIFIENYLTFVVWLYYFGLTDFIVTRILVFPLLVVNISETSVCIYQTARRNILVALRT